MNRKFLNMTNAHALTHGQSPASALRMEIAMLVSRARDVWTQYLTYRRTLSELQALSSRTLSDLDFNRADLGAIARREVYGR